MNQVKYFNLFCLLGFIPGLASASPKLDHISECRMVAVDLNGLLVQSQSLPRDYHSYVAHSKDAIYLDAKNGTRIKHATALLCVENKIINLPNDHTLKSIKWFEELVWKEGERANFPVGLSPRKVGVFIDDNPRFCWVVELYDKNVAIVAPGSVCADGFFQILPNAKVAFLQQPQANSISELVGLK